MASKEKRASIPQAEVDKAAQSLIERSTLSAVLMSCGQYAEALGQAHGAEDEVGGITRVCERVADKVLQAAILARRLDR
jgi:hypothetical protein